MRDDALYTDDTDLSTRVFHELMAKRVNEILLVSSPYDAFIMEEDGGIAERIIHEYRGLNLSKPPIITWVSTAKGAFEALSERNFDMVIVMPRLGDMDPLELCREIKKLYVRLPIYFLAHDTGRLIREPRFVEPYIDRAFVWRGSTDLLMALIKSSEDRMNVVADTEAAEVRVIIFVEDSPLYRSSILPFIYKEIVMQTQAVMDESLNEKYRLLRMRARPKILLAETYEEAEHLYRKFEPYVFCVISDVRYPRAGEVNDDAGFDLISMIKKEAPDLPLLMISNEEKNRARAEAIPAIFFNKTSETLHADIRFFFVQHLGFGTFLFRLPDGSVVARAESLRSMGTILDSVPVESICYHAERNEFSTWLMARAEMKMAKRLRNVKLSDFDSPQEAKVYLTNLLRKKLKERHRGVVADFITGDFDTDADFIKIGRGSLGGKARGLAFVSTLLRKHKAFFDKYPEVEIDVPNMMVISTEGFDSFVTENDIKDFSSNGRSDAEVEALFLSMRFPQWLAHDLEIFLREVREPLAVRSSSLLEDAHFRPCAGVYKTFMVPNSDSDLSVRLEQLIRAVKLVFASTYLESPRNFAKNTLYRAEEDKMAVIIQHLTGTRQGNWYYPSISGVAQSHNFYPVSYMKAEEGIAHIAIGLGQIVVEGGKALRFSPRYPEFLPQFSTVDDILKNSQQFLYALDLGGFPENFGSANESTVTSLEVDEIPHHDPIKLLSSTYLPDDNKIVDAFNPKGFPVMTFASVLKYKSFPLNEIVADLLKMGREGMGCPIEIEFAVNLFRDRNRRPRFTLLQIRPMVVCKSLRDVEIDEEERAGARCFSKQSMGSSRIIDVEDIVFVRPDTFDKARTVEMAEEIGRFNAILEKENRKYLLAGPGRWGTADRWLGIPVNWGDISFVETIIENQTEELNADASQGAHFFHNITSLGINYITIGRKDDEFIDMDWLAALPPTKEGVYIRHVRLERPLVMKIDGKRSMAVIREREEEEDDGDSF